MPVFEMLCIYSTWVSSSDPHNVLWAMTSGSPAGFPE